MIGLYEQLELLHLTVGPYAWEGLWGLYFLVFLLLPELMLSRPFSRAVGSSSA